jgi:hypothetical protein
VSLALKSNHVLLLDILLVILRAEVVAAEAMVGIE